MRSVLRSITFGMAATFAGAALSQSYFWSIDVTINGCYPGQTVEITATANGNVMFQATESVDPGTCTFTGLYPVFDPYAELTVSTQCNGMMLSFGDTAAFNFFQDTAFTSVTFSCGGGDPVDCNGIVNGPDMPGTPCDDGNPQTVYDTWTPFCTCLGVAPGECWTLVDWEQVMDSGSPVPFEMMLVASSAGAQPITYSWYFGWPWVLEGTSTTPSWQRTFAPGESMACQVVAIDANGCESQWGNVEGSMNCDGIMGSPNWPGLPCTVPGTTQPGTWSADCICEADTTLAVDCEGNPGGGAVAGTPCTVPGTIVEGTWSVDCVCIPNNTAPCEACFTFNSPAPFVVVFSNCSVLPSGENGVLWEFPDGSTYEPPPPFLINSPSYTFDSAGAYPFCFTILDYGTIDGCSFCDTLYVDEQGNVTSTPPSGADCLGVVNGTDLPGTPCTVPGTILEGMWSASCVCEPNNPLPCQADFWVVQAMGSDSLPVPYELWVWNLSSGGSGNFQFLWNFGDGTTSTDAFPTHTYDGNGPYVLCLTIADNNNCTDTHCDTVSINGDGIYEGMVVHHEDRNDGFTVNVQNPNANAVQDIVSDNSIAVWPNPATDELNVALVNGMKGTVTVMITDLDGRTVKTERMSLAGGRSQLRIATSGLNAGMYLLRILPAEGTVSDGSMNLSQRFVKTD